MRNSTYGQFKTQGLFVYLMGIQQCCTSLCRIICGKMQKIETFHLFQNDF